MVARRAITFNQANKIGYVYIFIAGSGTPLGYYVIKGKVASLSSFLVPQERLANTASYDASVLQDADIDGTYGENVEGVFFFTDTGVYVELPTNGPMGYLFSDQPLPISVPRLAISPVNK